MPQTTTQTTVNAAINTRLETEKDCKGCVKYATQDAEAILTNVYVSRRAWPRMPKAVVVTITPVFD